MQQRVRIKLCQWRAAGKAWNKQRIAHGRGLACAGSILIGLLLVYPGLLATVAQAQEQKKMELPSEKLLLDDPGSIPGLLAAKKITIEQIPNPHWREDGCRACHTKLPDKRGLNLRTRNIDRGCNTCHADLSKHSYIHPSGVKPTRSMLKQMPAAFRNSLKQAGGKVSCITCHDLPLQCLPERARKRGLNPRFFRGGPYKSRTEICFRCHDERDYQRLNPHDQIDEKGKLKKDRCGVCHEQTRYLVFAPSVEEVDFNVKGDLSVMCTGCHQEKPHPGGSFSFGRRDKGKPDHLVKPPPGIIRRMIEQQRKNKVRLPLDPNTGKVYCATCHEPHEKGVIRSLSAVPSEDVSYRLRKKEICLQCHDK